MPKELNGIDLTDLPVMEQKPEYHVPKTVKDRVCHIDGDFAAYMVSYDDNKSFEDMCHNCDELILKQRLRSGAQFAQIHLTPSESDKGGRYDIAIQKEYQANRKNKPKPKMLHAIREWMHKERRAKMHMHLEADDGMSIAQYAAIAAGTPNLSIICTKDKDLLGVPGLTMDWDSGEITDTGEDPFGWITLDSSKTQKKIRGRGQKYFWAQMLTGDAADNIQGLPKLYIDGVAKACGPVLAYSLLEDVSSNAEAFELVRQCYKDCGEGQGFVHWKTGEEVQWGKVFTSEAKLLWMRRNPSENDVLDWLKEIK